MTRTPVNPELLIWARERAGVDTLALAGRFPKLVEWEPERVGHVTTINHTRRVS